MKKTILMMLTVMAALSAAATDRFYIEDFTVASGETCMVSILLDNETEYTAFQCDIYMPEGLTVEQEDGDYIFDLTSRKARDHNIASQVQVDGSIRVMSYSPGVKAYSGNSGALVTFNVTAAQDFAGPATIWLKNILFTTTAGIEVAFVDEECIVTTGLNGDVNNDGDIDIRDVTVLIDYLLTGVGTDIQLDNADIFSDGAVDIRDVTALIDFILSH